MNMTSQIQSCKTMTKIKVQYLSYQQHNIWWRHDYDVFMTSSCIFGSCWNLVQGYFSDANEKDKPRFKVDKDLTLSMPGFQKLAQARGVESSPLNSAPIYPN